MERSLKVHHKAGPQSAKPGVGIGVHTYHDLLNTFRALKIDPASPIIAHASLSVFGWIHGGPQAMVGAMLACFSKVIMPSFTYKTMITPEVGPPNNALRYGDHRETNHAAQIFHTNMPADRLMGIIPETLRTHPKASRSRHPILSFTGIHSEDALEAQTYDDPLAPIRVISEQNGWVLLIGTDHRTNTSIHLAERISGRKQFVRWAKTSHGVAECAGFPGCSEGFQAIEPDLKKTGELRIVRLNPGEIQAIPLNVLIQTVKDLIGANPLALLCEYPDCLRCQATIQAICSPESIPFFGPTPRSETI